MHQHHILTAVVQSPFIHTRYRDSGVTRGKSLCILHQNRKGTRCQFHSTLEGIINPLDKMNATHCHHLVGDILKFNELKNISIHPIFSRRVIHDFTDHQIGETTIDDKGRFGQCAPLP